MFALSAPAAMAQFGSVEVANPSWRINDGFSLFDPQLVVDSSGRAFLESFQRDASGDEQAVVYERCGNPAAWNQRLLGSPADELFPVGIVGNAAGDVLAAWKVTGSGSTTTFYSSFKPAGGNWGAAQQIVSGEVSDIDLAIAGNGNAVAAWNQANPAAVKASVRPASGSWGSPTTLKSANQNANVAMSGTGDAVVISFASPSKLEAYYRPAGGSFGSAETVDDLPFPVQPVSQLVEFDGNGKAVVVYTQQGKVWGVVRSGGAWQTDATLIDDAAQAAVQKLARHPSGLVAVWTRGAGSISDDTGVARFGTTWETKKLYDVANSLGPNTVAANGDGEILFAARRVQGSSSQQEEIWGTTVGSLTTAWPANLARLSPAGDTNTRYRDPVAAGNGDHFVLAWGVHGGTNQRTEAIATGSAAACPAGGGNQGGNQPNPVPVNQGGNQVVVNQGTLQAFGANALVTLNLAIRSIPARGPLSVGVANGNGFPITGNVAGQTTQAVVARRRKARRIALKTKAFKVAARSKTTVKLSLPKALRRLLKRKRRLKLTLRAVVKDPAGNSRTVTKRVSPKLKKKRKRKR